MGIDREALKAKIKRMKDPNNRFGPSDMWRPEEEGKTYTVRFIDNPFTDTDPFVELWFHYRIGKGRHILCPRKNWGKTCPICEWAKAIIDNNPEDKELAKDLWPKQRFHAVVVDRADPDLVPKYYGFGKTNYFELIDKLHQEDYKDYMDVKGGLDVTVKAEKKVNPETGKKAKYPTTTYNWRRQDSPLADSDDKIREILGNIKRLDEIFKPMTIAEIKDRLNEWMSHKEDIDVPDTGGEETRGVETASSDPFEEDEPTQEPASVEDIHAEFEKALAEAE